MNSIIDETRINEEFLAFIDKYKQDYDLFKPSNYKYENGRLYREAQAGWFVESIRPTRVVGNFKIYAIRVMCAMSYTRYYIANVKTGDVFTFESSHIYGWNGTLEKLVLDLNLVMLCEYSYSLIPKEHTFDISVGI